MIEHSTREDRCNTAGHFVIDRRVKLILSAAAPATELYRGERLKHDFLRTQSRLQEMQSHDYLAEAHRP